MKMTKNEETGAVSDAANRLTTLMRSGGGGSGGIVPESNDEASKANATGQEEMKKDVEVSPKTMNTPPPSTAKQAAEHE